MSRYAGYTVADYGIMIDCAPRMDAYDEALRRAVTPGCTVIDIGAGFGMFSLLAAKYGAGKVIAIEPDPSIELVMPLAQANGFADRIEIVRDISTRYTPEQKADVIVADCRGNLPLFQHHISTIRDARERLLAPGGVLIPLRDTLRMALVSSEKDYRYVQSPWKTNKYGIDLSPGERFASNHTVRTIIEQDAIASQPTDIAVIDYRTITEPNLDATVELVADADRTIHGVVVWFDAEIAEGAGYSNASDQEPLVYQQRFMPFAEAVPMAAGDRAKVRLRATFQGDDYIWTWDSDIIDGATGSVRQKFRQSTFGSKVFSPNALKTLAKDSVPNATETLAIDRDCLAMVGDAQGHTVDDIARAILAKYPGRFGSHQKALDHVAAFFKRYSES